MRGTREVCVALLFVAAGLGSRANAQLGIPHQPNPMGQLGGPLQSPISPYINILRGGAPAAVNYFNLVQPQLQFNASIGQLQSQQNLLGQAIATPSNLGQTTGHPIAFANYSHYYSYQGVGTGTAMSMGGRSTFGMGGTGMGGMGMGGMGMGGMGMGGMGMGGMGMGGISGMGGYSGIRSGMSNLVRPGR